MEYGLDHSFGSIEPQKSRGGGGEEGEHRGLVGVTIAPGRSAEFTDNWTAKSRKRSFSERSRKSTGF